MDYLRRLRLSDQVFVGLLTLCTFTISSLILIPHVVSFYGTNTAVDAAACNLEQITSRLESELAQHSRFVAILGDGVSSKNLVLERPYNTQFAQGYDLYQGVAHALQREETKRPSSLGFVYVDDGGNPTCAARIADALSRDPRLLAVIGHSTTSCTQAALPFYARSNIPVLVPAATSPSLDKRFLNWFRLPSNDFVQSLVIADLITNKLKANRVIIVWDNTAEAREYADYLRTTIQNLIGTGALLDSDLERGPILEEGPYPISLDPLNYSYLLQRLVSSGVDVVVFAGFGSLAREFLFGLDRAFSQHEKVAKPKVILTDGCKIPRITGYSFDTFITFPAPPIAACPYFQTFTPEDAPAMFKGMYLEESFEIFGFDAVQLLLASIEDLEKNKKGVSRRTIIGAIPEAARKTQACQDYEFSGSENRKRNYYVYSLTKESVEFVYDDDVIREFENRIAQ